MTPKERADLRAPAATAARRFVHGRRPAARKIVQQVPSATPVYAATQVIDEARHVKVYAAAPPEFELAYPITPTLKSLLDNVLTDAAGT